MDKFKTGDIIYHEFESYYAVSKITKSDGTYVVAKVLYSNHKWNTGIWHHDFESKKDSKIKFTRLKLGRLLYG
jgi:hypothetical protein